MKHVFFEQLTQEMINELTLTPWRTTETFVTRGAFMHCTNGTHEEVLNQPTVNGVYINENPMMTVKDCNPSTSSGRNPESEVVGKNIDGNFHSFGYCRSEIHPRAKIVEEYKIPPDKIGGLPVAFNPETYEMQFVYPCVPKIDSEWEFGSSNVFINNVAVLTNKSCLRCKNNGTIRFLTNGMDIPPIQFIEHYMK
ncbi:DUF4280 domain-containing protein [Cohnella terricola]|uniref:DUF4280 domain-containing protein n=1 Tax=Cohnella terricola TaxID=1289167 RepID=A0A559J5D0_9BACL|nr:DUF4280 domain-containing protein [Cohnella terricola]TVX95098.1 DUF4280 domain-containing protein [Cohnella terricola]